MNGRPTISVVIPCWNAEKWIARAIQSVLDQDYPHKEVIVIDDGSTDGSLEIIKSFGDKIRWETGPNRGAITARNRGLTLCTSEYVLFLDADDYLECGSLAAWVDVAERGTADVVLAPFVYEYNGFRKAGRRHTQPCNASTVLCDWLNGLFTPPCSVLWRSAFLRKIGGWNPLAAARMQDGELAMRAMLWDPKVAVSDLGLGVYVQHDSPYRISRRVGESVLRCEHEIFDSLWQLAQKRNVTGTAPQFARAYYRLAYQAYSRHIDMIGDSALAAARRLGLKGHVGTARHVVLASLMGLRNKMHFTGLMRTSTTSFRAAFSRTSK